MGYDRSAGRARLRAFFLLIVLAVCGPALSDAQAPVEMGQPPPNLSPPSALVAQDTPNDRGESIDLSWTASPQEALTPSPVASYAIERAVSASGPFEAIGQASIGETSFTDNSVKDGNAYFYRLRTTDLQGRSGEASAVIGPVSSKGQWFDRKKASTLLLTFGFCMTVIGLIRAARKGKKFYIRPIPGLSAVDEAIGRATEMGRPILFVPGLGVSSEVSTLAAFTLLGRVAKKTAEYQTQVIVPCYDPIVMTICQEIVKSSFMDAGRPELYRENDVYFVTQDQFSYTAAVNGIMLRELPATNFYIGKFYAESLVLAETGSLAGSIQIAGTDEMVQIPFFVAACDYTLIGEELYASSAYLSQEPPLLGTLKAQDYGKAIGAIVMVIGAIMALADQRWFVDFFKVQ